MDSTLLIDAIVRQTTILLAQLATAPGGRATLANTGVQVFSSLVKQRFEPVTREQLAERIPTSPEALDAALSLLLEDGRIQQPETDTYAARQCVIPVGAEAGREAAVFDHYQAVVTTVCTKLREGTRRAMPGEWIGGSTYSFEVTEDQPSFQDVVGFLEATRRRAVELRQRGVEENRRRGGSPEGALRVIAYVGQTVLGVDEEEKDA